MGTNCALVADLFLFYYERDFMISLSQEKQADIIEAFNSTSRYFDDLSNIDNIYFDQMDRIYPIELQLNKANSSDTRHCFWIWIDIYLMVQLPPKFVINGTILILIQSIFLFWMAMSPGVLQMGYTYLSLLDSWFNYWFSIILAHNRITMSNLCIS